jgi:O-antigen/teichoic acid export membrane protein
MTESSLKQKTAKGLFWGGINSGSQQLLSVAFGIYLARTLNADDYGLVGLLAIFMGITNAIINSGFSVALTNKQQVTHEDYNAVFWFAFFTGMILYIILFFSAPLIAGFFHLPELVNLSRVLFISSFISGLGIVSFTIMFKKLMTKQQAIIDIISITVALSAAVLLAVNGFSYWALVMQSLIQVSVLTVLRFIIAPWKPTLTIRLSPLKSLFSFSIKILFTSIFMQITANIFSILLGKFYTVKQVGYYAQGQKWMVIGNQFIGSMIAYVTQPVLVQVNEDRKRQIGVLRKLIRFSAFLSFPLMLGLAFIGEEFILITIGEKWLPSVPFLQLFCIWGSVGFIGALYSNLIFSKGNSKFYMYAMIMNGILQLAALVLLYPLGIFSMLSGYISACFIGLAIWHFYVNKLTGLRLRDVLKDILPYLVTTLGCFFVAWLLTKNCSNIYWLISGKIIISGLLYLLVMKISNSVIFKECVEFIRKK